MLTQHQKIFTIMVNNLEKWFLPQDFMDKSLGHLFVGYEASARLSEMGSQHHDVIESTREGKYIKRRITRHGLEAYYDTLPADMKVIAKTVIIVPKDGRLFPLAPITN